ncbi:MAG: AAC(3) family N-acetyltransferase [Armatimonadetes bacterium]|nr:AAC(3) family N-acetyltransferase [Armatimonadota bacterium]
MKDLFSAIRNLVDVRWLMDNTEALWRKELGQRFSDYRSAALFTEQLMKESGLESVERLVFPADGKTAYQDKTMPLAWEATRGRLTVMKAPVPFENKVVADYERHPFHLIKGSVSTPPEGITTRLITEEQLFGGANARNAIVMLNPETKPRHQIYSAVCDLGALGLVTDCLTGRYKTPDAIPWCNACTDGNQWHTLDDDRPFIGFSVSPRVGDQLRAAARAGETLVHVVSDGRLYEGEVDLLTGILQGREEREVWLMAHLYEPLADDNSSGVISALEIARVLRKMIEAGELQPPWFTLRLVFGMEMYGFASYCDHRGGYLRNQVIGALNLDGFPIVQPNAKVWLAPGRSPFFGDYLMEEVVHACGKQTKLQLEVREEGSYSDDMFLNDPTTGLATVWVLGPGELWHNSAQDMSRINPELFRDSTALNGTWTAAMLTLNAEGGQSILAQASYYARRHLSDEAHHLLKELPQGDEQLSEETLTRASRALEYRFGREKERLFDFSRVYEQQAIDADSRVRHELSLLTEEYQRILDRLPEKLRSLVRRGSPATPVDGTAVEHEEESGAKNFASCVFPDRVTRGQPYDLRRVPKAARRELPDMSIYGPFARTLAGMDGTRSLEDLLREVEWEGHTQFSVADRKKYLGAIEYLTEYGYLTTRYTQSLGKANIVAALTEVGIVTGDLVLVHSGLSDLGHVEGGADTVIDAFLEVLGEQGTLLMPTFTQSFTCFGGEPALGKGFRPYHPKKSKGWVGRIPETFRQRDGVLRSAHPSHSVAGVGPLAEPCLKDHREIDPPTSRNSPFGKLMDLGGKMVFFGAGLASTTFFHFLEDEMDMPYLAPAVCQVENDEGNVSAVWVPKHLPGHRDFYRNPGEETKMYRRLLEDGLQISKTTLGFGEVKVMEAQQMYELGMEALKQDRWLMLCEEESCGFCSKYH